MKMMKDTERQYGAIKVFETVLRSNKSTIFQGTWVAQLV